MRLSVGGGGSVGRRMNKLAQGEAEPRTSLGSHISHLIPILDVDLLPSEPLPVLRHKQSFDILCREQLFHWTDGRTGSFQHSSPHHLRSSRTLPRAGAQAGTSSFPRAPLVSDSHPSALSLNMSYSVAGKWLTVEASTLGLCPQCKGDRWACGRGRTRMAHGTPRPPAPPHTPRGARRLT